jgi:protein-S-isoprenylcysteine O-methyltransferase Ste14
MAPAKAAAAALAVGMRVLLSRMRREFDARGEFTTATATAMWGCYALGGGLYAHALRTGRPAAAPARVAGLAAAGAGVATVAAGMGTFGSAGQITGTDVGALHENGIYRYSRNPQYAGFVLAGLGAAAVRSSVPAALVAVGYGAVCNRWVRVEKRHLQHTFGQAYVGTATAPRAGSVVLARADSQGGSPARGASTRRAPRASART